MHSAGALHRVQLGPIDAPAQVQALRQRLEAMGYDESYAVRS
ncbi:SPOR domain-containing protein [Halomonas lysinitropha]|nr:SPOR domain-containing protein [Halomonas lysinitropha]